MAWYENTIDDLILDSEQSETRNTKTFGVNLSNNRIGSMVDKLAALQQSIYFMLTTEADQYIIYPYTYGIQTVDLIGQPSYYIMAVLPGRIKDALMSDDRITDVTDFDFETNGRNLGIKFVIHSIYDEDVDAHNSVGNYLNVTTPIQITLGEIELALNGIIAIQNSYINGGAE